MHGTPGLPADLHICQFVRPRSNPFGKWIASCRLARVGPTSQCAGPLTRLTAEALFAPARIVRPEFAQACLAGLWLWHDFLDESHRISQDLSSAEGSYWHAIMHRREPDYGNSKYWFHRVGTHAVFTPLRQRVSDAIISGSVADLVRMSTWDCFTFVDLCERAARDAGDLGDACQKAQRIEWELLFDHCYRLALGED